MVRFKELDGDLERIEPDFLTSVKPINRMNYVGLKMLRKKQKLMDCDQKTYFSWEKQTPLRSFQTNPVPKGPSDPAYDTSPNQTNHGHFRNLTWSYVTFMYIYIYMYKVSFLGQKIRGPSYMALYCSPAPVDLCQARGNWNDQFEGFHESWAHIGWMSISTWWTLMSKYWSQHNHKLPQQQLLLTTMRTIITCIQYVYVYIYIYDNINWITLVHYEKKTTLSKHSFQATKPFQQEDVLERIAAATEGYKALMFLGIGGMIS